MMIVSVSNGSGTVAPPVPLKHHGFENSLFECMMRKMAG